MKSTLRLLFVASLACCSGPSPRPATVVIPVAPVAETRSTARETEEVLAHPSTGAKLRRDALGCVDEPIQIAQTSPMTGGSTVSGQWDSVLPGVGFNYMTGQLAGSCVSNTQDPSRTPPGLHVPAGAKAPPASSTSNGVCNPQNGTQTYSIQMIDSVENLSRTLEASVSASAHGIAWSAEASTSFVERNSVSSLSRFLLIEASVELRPEKGTGFTLTSSAAQSLKNNPSSFRRRCGDHFVRALWHGGIFRALYHFKSRTEDEAKSITADLKVAVSALGNLKTAADLRTAMTRFSSKVEMDVFVMQSGGGLSKVGTDPAALIEQLNTFFCNINPDNAPAVRLELSPYDVVNTTSQKIEYTGNHSDVIVDLSRLRGSILAERAYDQIQADGIHGDCREAADEYGRVASARSTALQQLDNMISTCRDLAGDCRRCTKLATDAPQLDVSKLRCERCASGGGIGTASGGVCRKCTWSIPSVSVSDPTHGERAGDNRLANLSCRRMAPDATVEVRAHGLVGMQLFDGACSMTCLPNGEASKISLTSGATTLGTRPYCAGSVGSGHKQAFEQIDIATGLGTWWSEKNKVNSDHEVGAGLMFHGFVYDCENAKGVGRKETLTGLELEVCEVGYCDN